MDNTQLRFLKPYFTHWYVILIAMIGGYILAHKTIIYTTPTYESTALLRLANINEGVPNSNVYKDFDIFANTHKIAAEIEVIKSYAIISKAIANKSLTTVVKRQGKIKDTELFSDAPFKVASVVIPNTYYDKPFTLSIKGDGKVSIIDPMGQSLESYLGDTLMWNETCHLSLVLNTSLLDSMPDIQIVDTYTVTFNSEEAAVKEIMTNLHVSAIDDDVPVIRISYTSSNPHKAAYIPNLLAQIYIQDYISTKHKAAEMTSDFLKNRINEIATHLSLAENKILNYRQKNKITNIVQETETDLRKLSQLKIQQTNLKMSLDAVMDLDNYMHQEKGDFLSLAPNFEAFTDLLSTEMIKKVKELQAEKKDLLLQYTPKDERVKAIDYKIEDIASYLKESIRNTRHNLEIKYNKLVDDINLAEESFMPIPEKEKEMTILTRDFELYQSTFNFLNHKKIEAEIAKSVAVSMHRILTPAVLTSTPIAPNIIIIKAVGVLLGLILAIFSIFIYYAIYGKIRDVHSIESHSAIPIIAAIPRFNNNISKNRYFAMLLSQWRIKNLLTNHNTLTFTSFSYNEGATFVADAVAELLRKQRKKILTIHFITDTTHSNLYTFIPHNEGNAQLLFNILSDAFVSFEAIQEIINDIHLDFNHIVVYNTTVGDVHTMALMSTSDVNIFCVDTQKTPENKINHVDILAHDYSIPHLYFAINNIHYRRSILAQCLYLIQGFVGKKSLS